jgi:hypothetical protein
VATTVAGATLGVAGAAVKTTAKVTGKAAGATVRLTAQAAGHALKGPPCRDDEQRSDPRRDRKCAGPQADARLGQSQDR